MDNHYHLMIETPDGNLSLGMRQLNGVYTQARNKRYNKSGHLFHVGKRLTESVEQHGYRQSELARHIGVHYSTISRWLRERENARRKT
jgi:hypothetical protein